MKQVAFAVPGDLNTPTGGYVYDRRIVAELPANGWQVHVLDLGNGFPRPSAPTRAKAHAALWAVAGDRPIVIDGLAFGVLAAEAYILRDSHKLVALVHHPLALEAGLSAARQAAFRESERAALSCARAVIVTSTSTAHLIERDYGVPAERISVVRPGTDRATAAPREREGPVNILAVGAVVPRKGYDILIAALAKLADLPWRLVIAGDRGRSPPCAQSLDADIVQLKLSDRVQFTGAVAHDALATLYAAADLFVLPSRFEGYGMAFTEAIAYGLPVVGTNAGAIPDTVPAGSGILVPPDDVDALATALRRLIADPTERAALVAGARAAATSFPTWNESAQLFAQVLDRVP